MSRKILLIAAAALFLPFLNQPATAEISQKLYCEIMALGRSDGKIVDYYGVKCLAVRLQRGEALYHILRRLPSVNQDYYAQRKKISLINRLSLFYASGWEAADGTKRSQVLIPLEPDKEPQVFPGFDHSLASHRKYLLIDCRKGYAALYEQGKLKGYYAVSSGMRRTPSRAFRISGKEKDHYSSLYDNAWMPWSCHLFGNYFLHGGVLPGYDDSRGCIRVFNFNGDDVDDSKIIFNWVEIGTPGRIQ